MPSKAARVASAASIAHPRAGSRSALRKTLPPVRFGCLLLALAGVGGCEPGGESQDAKPQVGAAEKPLTPLRSVARFNWPPAAVAPDEEEEQLAALGYVDWVPAGNQSGVTHHTREAFKGFNFYNSRPQSEAVLFDMNGCVVHSWITQAEDGFHHAELTPTGEVFAIIKDSFIAKLDVDSRILWKHSARVHHDLDVKEDGGVYVLAREDREVELGAELLPILDDFILVLDAEGQEQGRLSIFDVLGERISEERWQMIREFNPEGPLLQGEPPDAFHTNSIQQVSWGPGRESAFLLSVRELGLLVVIRRRDSAVLWEWGRGELQQQHHATLLYDGTVMVFDNGTRRRKSRILRIDPETNEIVQVVTDSSFFSHRGGGVQRLANGNLLLTNFGKGLAMEVAPGGTVVWSFSNPHRRTPKDRGSIYRMTRFPESALPFVAALEARDCVLPYQWLPPGPAEP